MGADPAGHEQHPAEINLLANLANYHLDAGQEGKAVECYEQVLEIDPNNEYALTNYGNHLARQKGQSGKAEQLLKRALKSDASFVPAHYNLACAYALRGQKEKMLEAIKRTTTLDKSTRKEILEDEDFVAFRDDPDFLALVKGASRKPRA